MAERGRPRSFDRQEALRRAMEMFWAKGFEETSLADLTQAMGIAPPSLYAAFGSKEALFREAVELYQQTMGCEIWDALDQEPTIVGAIEAFLMNTAAAYSREDVPRGCLIVLGARHAEEAGNGVCDDLRALRTGNIVRLRQRFARAVAEGELPADFDGEAAAAFYATLQNGMSLMARDGADAGTLAAVARGGVGALAAGTFANSPATGAIDRRPT